MRTNVAVSWMVCACLAAGTVGCDGGGGGGASNADVTGVWNLYYTPDLTGVESAASVVALVQNGTTFTGTADAEGITGTVSGSSVTAEIYVANNGSGYWERTTFLGTVTGGHMEGTFVAETAPVGTPTASASATGTWRAELVTRALVNVTGTWTVTFEWGGSWSPGNDAVLAMAADGTVTGTYGSSTITGTVHGYDLDMTIDDGAGYVIWVDATVDGMLNHASGTWLDSDGDGGDWVADR